MPRVIWQLPGLLAALLVVLPILFLLSTWAHPDGDIWAHLVETQLLELLVNSAILLVGVGLGVTLVGVSLAWLTALCEFPGRQWLDWALIMPLAIPPYVLAFVVLGIFDFNGELQQSLLEFSVLEQPVDVRNPLTIILVMTGVLYPYVYLLTRNILIMQGRSTLDAARTLGATGLQSVWRIGLPMARPGIVAGVSLALMEVLADFGVVSIFNFNTFTTAIYKSWIGLFSLETAAQLSSLLLGFVLLVLLLEYASRGRGRIEQPIFKSTERFRLRGWKAWMATAWCLIVLSLSALLPLAQLISWGWQARSTGGSLFELMGHSFILAGSAAVIIASLALFLASGARFSALGKAWATLANLGYALPGSVLAVAIVSLAGPIDSLWINLGQMFGRATQPLLVGSIAGLLLAYMVRFIRPAYGPVNSGLERIRPHIPEAAQLLGASRWRILRRVHLPILTPALLTASLLVFVDVLKEMPATLLLRPFGWETLATRIYQLTGESQWQWAAVPALVLVSISILPVVLLILQSRRTYRR